MNTHDDNIKFVEQHIMIRFNPYIYAFSTNTIPNYLKVGDTFRGVDTRLGEWQKIIAQKLYPQIVRLTEEYRHKALLSDEIYFRDYSVHEYLESLGKHRIEDEQIRKLYSQEFFEDTTPEDIAAAIKAITEDFASKELNKKYAYYRVSDNKSATFHGDNSKDWKLRPNQEVVVKNFLERGNQKELLMYAVMRFGKSFTAMFCAKEAKARKILVVSAKADVAGEWQKTVETPECFKGFKFVCDDDFKQGFDIKQELAESEENRVVVFLTLQNLSGKDKDGKNIKKKLQQVFDTVFDLIIVDETHYGAWAHSYGAPLKDADDDVIKNERKEYATLGDCVAKLRYKQKLHLSGTPYNLLYDNKFNKDNIIATCQFKDILCDKAEWDKEHFDDIENGIINPDTGKPYQEYDNPYFGFPNMLRFAFNIPEGTRQKLSGLKSAWTLNDLFEIVIEEGVAKFIHEREVLELLKAIDGSARANGILGFLNIPKIKDNDVCKHMVFVLPRKYACDAMANLLRNRRAEFVNLSRYTVLNITGHNMPSELDSVDKVKEKISELEKSGQKSITLTVYKMLTGVTVKEWDTMVMLKNTSSAQEYDQAIFRIQNQYVEEYTASNGNTLKIDKKPQTILVDFDPVRMFTLQGLSAKIVDSVNHSSDSLDNAIADELKFFPIIAYNAEKLVKVEPTDLVKLITEYSNDKSIVDSVQSVVLDKNILADADIKAYIISQSATSSKNESDVAAHKSDNPSDMDFPDEDCETDTAQNGTGNHETNGDSDDKTEKDLEKKFRMCVARLSFYVFLSNSRIENLQDIIDSLKDTCAEHERNRRIFDHLRLNSRFVRQLIRSMSRYYAELVNDAIKRADILSHDESLDPQARALNAIRNFNRFSDSEIVTPYNICADMVNCIEKDELVQILNRGDKILDIASKTGEFALALYNLLKDSVDERTLRNGIYSISTSGTAYEFTRHIYEVLGLNVENIARPENLTAYDLLKITKTVKKKEEVDYYKVKSILTQNKTFSQIKWNDVPSEGATDMINFGAVVGNPPYQKIMSNTSDSPVYHLFMSAGFNLAPIATFITPARYLFNAGKTPKEWNENILKDKHFKIIYYTAKSTDVFPNVDIKGGVAISMRNAKDTYGALGVFLQYQELNSILSKVNSKTTESLSEYVYAPESYKFTDALHSENAWVKSRLSNGHLYDVTSNIFEKLPELFYDDKPDDDYIGLYGRIKNDRVIKWIKRSYVAEHDNLYSYKVIVPKSNGSGALGEVLSTPVIGQPVIGHTQTFISIGKYKTEFEATALLKYIKSKFLRVLLGVLKVTQDNKKSVWKLVPLQDFTENSDIDWRKSVPEIDKQLYAKYNLSQDEINFIESMIKPME